MSDLKPKKLETEKRVNNHVLTFFSDINQTFSDIFENIKDEINFYKKNKEFEWIWFFRVAKSYLTKNEIKKIHEKNFTNVELICTFLIDIKKNNPYFIYKWEDAAELLRNYEKYLNWLEEESVDLEKSEIDDEKKVYIDKMFRFGEYSDSFYMNQKTWNCAVIAGINAMTKNLHFKEELYENINIVKNENPLKTKWWYNFPDWEYIEVALEELKKEEYKWIDDIEEYIESLESDEKKELIERILKQIIREMRKWISKIWDIDIPFKNLDELYETNENWKTTIKFPDSFVKNIIEQIKNRKWEYYELFLQNLTKEQQYLAVKAPIWYKLLEKFYSKRLSKTRKDTEWKLAFELFESFLDENIWDSKDILDNSNKISKIYISNVLKNFNSWNYIVTTSIDWKNKNMWETSHFLYNSNWMAYWHGYSIVWFDEKNKIVKVVNPWDNKKIMDFNLDDFFKIFTNTTIIRRTNDFQKKSHKN